MRNLTELDNQLNADLKRQALLDAISNYISSTRQISQDAARAVLSDWTTPELIDYAWHHDIDTDKRIQPDTIEVRIDQPQIDSSAVARSVLAAARRHGA